MNGANWNDSILTLVTFVPTAGALLLLFFPRRDRDIRLFALVISLLTFVLSLHLPAHLRMMDRQKMGLCESAVIVRQSLPPPSASK